MELEIPELLAVTLQGQVGAQSPLGLQLGGQGAGTGTRVVSSHHFDGHSLNLLYQLSRSAGARDLVFQLGRFWRVKGPGLVILIPGIQQMVRIDLRVVTLDVLRKRPPPHAEGGPP